MANQDIHDAHKEVEQNEKQAEQTVAKEPARYAWLAFVSILFTVAAWIFGSCSGEVAIVGSALGIAAGAFAMKSQRKSVRNTAITSIIAAAVLLIVVSAFYIVIYAGLKTIYFNIFAYLCKKFDLCV